MSRSKTLVILTADSSYAYPSLLAARSIREKASRQDFDIWLFAVDFSKELLETVSALGAKTGVTVVPMSSADYMKFDLAEFRTAADFDHLKPPVLARLVTGRFIPDRYEQVLYIDGDTLAVGDLSELIAFDVPEGVLLGVEDMLNQWKHDSGPYGAQTRRYLEGIGLPLEHTFYNTGVLYARRETWRELGENALRFFIQNTEKCIYPVDSSFNVTARGRWRTMSARWNFMAPLRMWDLDSVIQPRLYHFTGKEKPWGGDVTPWRDFWPIYRDFAQEADLQSIALKPESAAQIRQKNMRSAIWKLKSSTIHLPRRQRGRAAIIESEKRAIV